MVINIPKNASKAYREKVAQFARDVLAKFDENDKDRIISLESRKRWNI